MAGPSTLSNLERNECNFMGGAGGCGPHCKIGNSVGFSVCACLFTNGVCMYACTKTGNFLELGAESGQYL